MCLKRAFESKDDLPVWGNTHTNCSLLTVKIPLLLTNNLSKKFFMYKAVEFLEEPLFLKTYFRVLIS